MAWPLTALRTYVANTTPTIRASDLNDFQTAINGVIGGTYSLKAFAVDSVGGVVVAARTGTGKVSAVDSGTGTEAGAAPLCSTVALGEFGRGLVPIGWARIDGATGDLLRGINVYDVSHTVGTGTYYITFNTIPSNPTTGCPVGCISNSAFRITAIEADGGGAGGRIRVHVNTATAEVVPVAADATFNFVLFAE